MRPLLAVNFPKEPNPEETHPPRAGCGGCCGAGPLLPRHQVKDDGENQCKAESLGAGGAQEGRRELSGREKMLPVWL